MKLELVAFFIVSVFASCLNPSIPTVKEKKSPVVVMIFAGREEYLSILMRPLTRLMGREMIDEIHFWQFTKNKGDIEYLESMSNIHKTSSNFGEYRIIHPLIRDMSFHLRVKAKNEAYILINNKYEIVLGEFKTVMRKSIHGRDEVETLDEMGILNESEFKEFVIELDKNRLSVNNLMSLEVHDKEITSISVHTGNDSEGYWDYEETRNKNFKLFDTKERVGPYRWNEAYKYYRNYDFDVLLKVDDDIVYMDEDRFEEYLNFIKSNPGKKCIFPNLVNHAVSLYYNNKNNLVPDGILKEQYVGKSSAREFYYYFKDGSQAAILLEYFLNNVETFTRNNISPISLDGHRVSICMFGILKENYKKMFISDDERFNDERYVYRQKGNFWYPRFVACHYQFGPQMRSGLDKRFLNDFNKLSQK